ncbi:ABC transporter ATP-binding protein [Candidatus Pelagibacter sp.]|nr:ABC transporter ATP-binding protein [Candidatus Pelagibacter sp.]
MKTIKKIFEFLTPSERKQFYLLLLLILIMALLDVLGIASILPFMSLLTNQELLETNIFLIKLYKIANKFGVTNTNDFIIVLGFSTFLLLILSLSVKALTTYAQLRFTLMREFSIGKRLIEGYLHQPYSWFLSKNSANLGKSILSEVNLVIYGAIIPMMTLIAQGTVTLAIITLIIFLDPILALRVGLVLVTCYAIIFFVLKKLVSRIGAERLRDNELRFNVISEAFGASKEVKFSGLEKFYIDRFKIPAKNYAKNLALVQIISQLPRHFLEAIAFGSMIIISSVLVVNGKDFNNIIPMLSLYVFAGYRLIPALQQIYSSLTQLNFSKPALYSLNKDLMSLKFSEPVKKTHKAFKLNKQLIFKNISYKYPKTEKYVLNDVSLNIPAYSKIGIVGTTGGGKTTLIDLLLGLLTPTHGKIFVDDNMIKSDNVRSWQESIGYVPQQIYLADDTVTSNIAFGIDVNNIDHQALEKAAKIANLHDFVISELPSGYSTIIGERGVRLSGGQRQRIGLARSLYHKPDVLILDEATSSLDNITEKMVIDEINNLEDKITIIIIAHRLSTVKNCDKIFLLEKGKIKIEGNYEELLNKSIDFKKLNLNS